MTFYRGDAVSYGGAHSRTKWVRGRAGDLPCHDCGGPAIDWSYNKKLGCPDERTEVNRRGRVVPFCPHPDHYQPRCRPCHASFDKGEACIHGHPYAGGNTYVDPKKGHRQCRTCRRERDLERVARRRNANA